MAYAAEDDATQRSVRGVKLKTTTEDNMIFHTRDSRDDVVNISGSANVQLGHRYGHEELTEDDYGSKYNSLLDSFLFDRIEFRVNNV